MARVAAIVLKRRDDGCVSAVGDLSASFGHRIPLPDGETDGVYASWCWDGARLTLEHDRYGFYPLFAWTTSDTCAIASDLEALLDLGAPRALDYEALSVFLRIGFFLGADTPFAAIRAVPPRAVLTWTPGGPVLSARYPRRRLHSYSRDEAIDAFIDSFRSAIRRRLPTGSFQTTLSGGRDSRHILLALIEAGARPSACVTVAHFLPRAADDVTVAAQLSARVGVRHVALPQRRNRLRTEREKNHATHFCTSEHAQFLAVLDYLRGSTGESYDGIAGDVLSQSSKFRPEIHERFVRGDARGVAEFLLDGYPWTMSDRALSRLLAPKVYRQVRRERAIERLLREIPVHMDAPNPMSSFLFWNRTRRNVALSPFGLMRSVTMYAPYLDRDVFDVLSGLPGAMLLDKALHTDAIARAYPSVADLRYEARARETRGAAARRVAIQLAGVAASARTVLRTETLLPRLAATAVDGATSRLWYTSVAIYLGQLASLAASRPM